MITETFGSCGLVAHAHMRAEEAATESEEEGEEDDSDHDELE